MKQTLLIASHGDNLAQLTSLKGDHYSLVVQPTASGTLAYLRNNTPNLIVLDADLPDASGLDICFRIKKVSRLKHLPVLLLLSSKDTQRQKAEAALVKADLIMTMPANKIDLEDAVRQLLAQAHDVDRTTHASVGVSV